MAQVGQGFNSATEATAVASGYQYNRKAQLKKIDGFVKDQTYALDGQTASITYQNDVVTSFTYDPNRRWLSSLVTKAAGTTETLKGIYTHNAKGQITAINATMRDIAGAT